MDSAWISVGLTVAVLAAYEALLVLLPRRRPHRFAASRHAGLRELWFRRVSVQPGAELLAVQTLRNSLMSATLLASTAALALMGTVTLAAPSLHASVSAPATGLSPRLVLELLLLVLLFASLVSTLMAVRLYNHAGFIGGMPVGSPERLSWTEAGVRYTRRAGLLYGVGLRQLVLVVPVVSALLLPQSGPVAAAVVAGVLYSLDRFDAEIEADIDGDIGPGARMG